jgi:ribose transport system substrate-binding protein
MRGDVAVNIRVTIPTWVRSVGAVAIVGLLAAMAGFTSSSAARPSERLSIAASTPRGSHQTAILTAEESVASAMSKPSRISLPPVGKPVPKHETIDLITVATPSIQYLNLGPSEAAKALGWKLNVITPQLTPGSYLSALQSVVQQKPNGLIFYTPFPLSSFQSELAALKKEGVPIVTAGAASYPVGGSSPVIGDTSGANIFAPLATLAAQQAVASAKGGANAAWVVDPSVPAWTTMSQHYQAEINAAGGTYNQINVPEADIGKDSPSLIVDYLEAHPGVKYVTLVVGAYDLGLQQALATAGLAGKVQVFSIAGLPADVAEIKQGTLTGTIAIETVSAGWRLVDLLVRHFVHDKLPYVHVPSEYLVVTKKDLKLASNVQNFPDDSGAFLTAWGLKS